MKRLHCSATGPVTRAALAALLAASLMAASPGVAWAQTKKTEKGDKVRVAHAAGIDRNGVLILIRGTLLALDQANKTGNYTVLRDLGSPNFQANSAAQLGDIFANQRKQALNFGAVAVLEPQLTLLPQIEPNGMLHMAGFFPSVPMQVNFELLFEPVNRQWNIYGVSVNLTSGAPQAPDTPAAGQPKPDEAGPPPDAPSMEVQPKKPMKP
ncbi:MULTISPECIES: hypothetical protein [unclassified Mesorhizobium]|uniref:hypothetical protein n=1 Tax=unclassified Mesorhizobium TaxID=325217 RepID=UPI000FD9F786|nr:MULTISPECIES: hypothetical protein [unclassified Mesorhizobium]TGR36749.1 hypothetical protein EN842_53210 [bacterium M00.F.Ca.ET.199.01.1.1]TGU17250.1 hypothetical protein EN799_63725 [bacterium M00.F.Ca.ET.156.01.1.1]TGV81882.1 hypothetical protein EN792_032715 [Mesorhizobium sp. M00.F.Ca.ET.149.01.1.1]TGR16703.1 hypothetical protein EN845_32650 [Mesorhizobium sp. M8A.F.Ca.ET.202.01.1.1]TGR18314.1 hypothetical protein EN840_32560 [Mesorhizobium sp. M8A.F.Ca.ET.197.01.1.1]